MVEQVKRINVTVPTAQLEQIRRLVASNPKAYPSVSAFVAEAVAARLADSEAHQMLLGVLRQLDGEPSQADRAWAEEALRLADEAARAHEAIATGAA
jgi:Arc/MetJ-type ribon-helix-helix transcriptional regulator